MAYGFLDRTFPRRNRHIPTGEPYIPPYTRPPPVKPRVDTGEPYAPPYTRPQTPTEPRVDVDTERPREPSTPPYTPPSFDVPRFRDPRTGSLRRWMDMKNQWYWERATPQEQEQWSQWKRQHSTNFVQGNFFNWVEKLRRGELGGWESDYSPPTEPFKPPPEIAHDKPTAGAGGFNKPISITYKFPDPSRPPTGQTQQAQTPQKPSPLINPLPSQAPAPTGVGGAGSARDWRGGLQFGTRPQNQGGFTNWLTRPARPPQAGGIWGRPPGSRTGWGGGYNAF